MSQATKLPAMTPVRSSNIESVGHDGMDLYVKFKTGTIYRYPATPIHHAYAMIAAPSAGSYFHDRVKHFHTAVRVP